MNFLIEMAKKAIKLPKIVKKKLIFTDLLVWEKLVSFLDFFPGPLLKCNEQRPKLSMGRENKFVQNFYLCRFS